jgi:carboxyl-terminal processing protease
MLAQGNTACETLEKINVLIQRNHYEPKPVDDNLSVFVFDAVIEKLDPYHNTLLDSEYQKLLSEHRLKIDDYIAENNCAFLTDLVRIYSDALKRKKSVIERIGAAPLNYNRTDSMRYSRTSFPFPTSEGTLEQNIRKRITFEVLENVAKISRNKDSLLAHLPKLTKKASDQIFDSNICKINTLIHSDITNEVSNDLFNIFCRYFDPHTDYFSADAKTSYLSGLATSNLSLGLDVRLNNEQEIVVLDVIPGGPAARSEKIDKDDVIVKVANHKQALSVTCTSLETIGNMIFSDANTELKLTVRKANGQLLDVPLVKQVMKATDNTAYSFIAEKDGTRIGYIRLPNFYSDFEAGTVSGCADDVAAEIVKLQQDKIDGLVIDLFDNGGGSMEEAAKLVGMFIDYGPVAVLEDNAGMQTIMKDMNRGMSYRGPLVVLINGSSASASEFFAGAMQDYNRAIIIGATSLGKATMQAILPLEDDEQQFVKLTMQKFYRVTGDSSQATGVLPDVVMPVLFDNLVERESDFETALAYKKIMTKARFTPFTAGLQKAADLSKTRVTTNAKLNSIKRLNVQIDAVFNGDKASVRVAFQDVFNQIHKDNELWDRVTSAAEQQNASIISNTTYDMEKMQYDTFLTESNKYKMINAKQNPYLEEAIAIITDLRLTNP